MSEDKYGFRIPVGWREIQIQAFTNGRELVICDQKEVCLQSDDESHNCDEMGCSTLSHVLIRAKVNREPLRTALRRLIDTSRSFAGAHSSGYLRKEPSRHKQWTAMLEANIEAQSALKVDAVVGPSAHEVGDEGGRK